MFSCKTFTLEEQTLKLQLLVLKDCFNLLHKNFMEHFYTSKTCCVCVRVRSYGCGRDGDVMHVGDDGGCIIIIKNNNNFGHLTLNKTNSFQKRYEYEY